jgi:hypothetical protein
MVTIRFITGRDKFIHEGFFQIRSWDTSGHRGQRRGQAGKGGKQAWDYEQGAGMEQ